MGLLVVAAGVLLAAGTHDETPEPPKGTSTGPAFALIELFTSEGCSSCPPADTALDAVAAEFRKRKKPVHALAFHVDYWDYIGWRDPFGSAEHTRRQRIYGTKMKLRSIYTPQMVVNGQREFVGSQRARARGEVANALERPVTVLLKATERRDGEIWRIDYTVEGAPAGCRVHAALVQSGLVSDVERGENAGRKLTHDNVVRAFSSGALPSGALTLSPGGGPPVVAADTRVVAFVQDLDTLAVLAAIDVPPR